MTIRSIVIVTILVSFLSCERWKLDRENFIQVEITSIDSLSIDSVRISGLIKDLTVGEVQEHGFLWTTPENIPDIFITDGNRSLGIKTQEDSQAFSTVLKLEPNKQYNLRAYATLNGEEYIYSESLEYRTGNAKVYTLDINYQRGLSLEATGRLTGTEKGFVAIKHGFSWSTVNSEPTLEDNLVDLGDRRNNEVFTAIIDSLQNDETHYFRAFAVLLNNSRFDTVFGRALTFDGDLNFWARRADFPVERGARAGFSIGPKGYIYVDGESNFWEFDPATNAWAPKANFEGDPRAWPVGFSIGQKGYLGTGDLPWPEPLTRDFWEYDPATDAWARKGDFGGTPRYRCRWFFHWTKGIYWIGQLISTPIRLLGIRFGE